MRKKFLNAMMALTMATAATLASVPQAEAHHDGGVGLGIAAGIIGLGVLGAAAAAHDYGPYYGPRYYSRYDGDRCFYGRRECHWTHRHCFENDYGDTVCRGGRYLCERPLICD
jgi:hypothetical protein